MSNYQVNLMAANIFSFVVCFAIFILLLTLYVLCNLRDRDFQEIHEYLFGGNSYSYPMMGDHIDYQALREISVIPNEEYDSDIDIDIHKEN